MEGGGGGGGPKEKLLYLTLKSNFSKISSTFDIKFVIQPL